MDYQRACGHHPGRMPQGVNRCAWRMPYTGDRMQMPRMPEDGMPDTGADCMGGDCSEHLAIVTSPVQCWQNLHTPCEALTAGTLFKDLYLPLVGCKGGNTVGNYRRMGGIQ